MTEIEKTILMAILERSEALEADLADRPLHNGEYVYSARAEYAAGCGIRVKYCEFLGMEYHDPNAAKRGQRALLKLRDAGLVRRITIKPNTRPTHCELTGNGRAEAKRLMGAAA